MTDDGGYPGGHRSAFGVMSGTTVVLVAAIDLPQSRLS